jgi:exopolysaccharide biosynthesis polyprenyl glycosylphosphotransferase
MGNGDVRDVAAIADGWDSTVTVLSGTFAAPIAQDFVPTVVTPASAPEPQAVTDDRMAAAVAPRVAPALRRRRGLERRHSRRLLLTDAVVVTATTFAASLATALPRLSSSPAPTVSVASASLPGLVASTAPADVATQVLVVIVTAAVWWVALALTVSRGLIGSGRRELARIAAASANAFGLLAIVFVVTGAAPLFAQVLVAAPVGVAALLAARALWRRRLAAERLTGSSVSRALVVGRPADVACVTNAIDQDDSSGYRVGGSVEFDVAPGTQEAATQIADEATRIGADAIVVASAAASDADFVKRLGWCLEGTAAELVVANGLVDVARARMSLHEVDGLPLTRVRMPAYAGGAHLVKRAFDIVVSSIALLGIALILPVIALAIVIDSRGPVFFAQERVGRDGRTFRMLKFRSMRTTAETELEALRILNEGAGPMFKLRSDPRVTRVGRFLRRYSIDELPQFWNVLVGDMSVVGPRPQLPTEVADYDGSAFRRLYVKPGITGPWQVGGRSDLSWQESVRIDLGYVENWSVQADLKIILRTAAVVIRPKGAY